MHRIEPTKLQYLALQFAEKAAVFVDNTERLLEARSGGFGYSKEQGGKSQGGQQGQRGDRNWQDVSAFFPFSVLPSLFLLSSVSSCSLTQVSTDDSNTATNTNASNTTEIIETETTETKETIEIEGIGEIGEIGEIEGIEGTEGIGKEGMAEKADNKKKDIPLSKLYDRAVMVTITIEINSQFFVVNTRINKFNTSFYC